MENCLGDDSAIPDRKQDKGKIVIKNKDSEKTRKLAYYYVSKLLKKGVIKKTNKFEKQGSGEKPLIIYEVVK